MSDIMHCWPTTWLEAADRAGFTMYKGGGEWVFISDAMRDKLAEFATEIQAAAVAAERAKQWQPIETAPRDGLLMMLCTNGGIVFVGKLNKHLQLWVDDQGRERFRTVTHWMPLPPTPGPAPSEPPTAAPPLP